MSDEYFINGRFCEYPKLLDSSFLIEYNKIPFMAELSPLSEDLVNKMQDLKDLRFKFQILYYPEEDAIQTEVFESPENALDFYISVADEPNLSIKCIITALLGNFSYSCVAPITLKSLIDLVDADNEIPLQIENTARLALATRILKDLPFNSYAHGCII